MNIYDILSEPVIPKFVTPELDFELNPDHFMKWLKKEGEKLTGKYRIDCSSMCEYSCLYIAMLLHEKELKGKMRIINGNYGFWGHFWISYTYEKTEYYIDLTLKQFIQDAPELSISKASKNKNGYNHTSKGVSIKDYVKTQNAFEFYTNPKTMKKPHVDIYPPIVISDIFMTSNGCLL